VKVRLLDWFAMIHPGLWGLSIAVLWINFWCSTYYIMPMVYSLRFLFSSFTSPLPWEKTGDGVSGLWNKEYLKHKVLEGTDEAFTGTFTIVPYLLILLLLVYCGLYFIVWKGIRSSSQVA